MNDDPRDDEATRTPGELASEAAARSLPAAIGQYKVLRLIAEGGMGAVYEAEQERPHRRVALKVIKAAWADSDLLRRFGQESTALGRLQHPGIAQIYESGTAETSFGAQPFFAMELIHGRPLTEYADARGLGLRERLTLVIQVCDAVEHAHRRGIIHRDLKPANILVDEHGQPKVLDFGLARVTDSDAQATRQTDMGQVLGTLQYMSPEQVRGDLLEVDTRTDVYSLGVILYELLAKKRPYEIGRTLPDAVQTILRTEAPSLGSVSRAYRGDVDTIVRKALEKDKERRYTSAASLSADLHRYLEDQPIVARPPSTGYQLKKFGLRHKALVAGTAAVFLALSVGMVAATWEAVRARRESARAKAMNGFMEQMLSAADPESQGDKDVTVAQVLTLASEKADKTLQQQPEVEADARMLLGATFHSLGKLDESLKELRRAVALHDAGAGAGTDAHVQALRGLAWALDDNGDLEESAKTYERAGTVLAALGPSHAKDLAMNYSSTGRVRTELSQYEEAGKCLDNAQAILDRLPGDHTAERADIQANRAILIKNWKGDLAEAERLSTAAAALYREHGDRILLATQLNDLAVIKMQREHYDEANAVYEEALAIERAEHGEQHQATARVLENMAAVAYKKGDLEKSLTLLNQVLSIREKIFGADSFAAARTRFNVGAVALANKEYQRALELTDGAIPAFRKGAGDKSTEVAVALSQRGSCLKGLGDPTGAMKEYQASLAIYDAGRAPTDGGRMQTLVLITRLQCQERDRRAASATAATAKSALKGDNPDEAVWIKRFDEEMAKCGD
ncbi:MAG TPA: serine/threonine-protein kinase [Candidatus Polarisedimenticolaceae bacterium]|nr:serine/threonine-protein kinase [Candidatus Polarisedimenticolaceae bacterium]